MKLNNNDDSHNSGLNLLIYNMLLDIESHPAWVCGLKPTIPEKEPVREVTPCVGVWIETLLTGQRGHFELVTPCVGVWIETWQNTPNMKLYSVTPCVGVWIETACQSYEAFCNIVTPCVGVWIETLTFAQNFNLNESHPAWVCGLKPDNTDLSLWKVKGHTLRGCVD